jgi:hypothetical protein
MKIEKETKYEVAVERYIKRTKWTSFLEGVFIGVSATLLGAFITLIIILLIV